MVEITKEMIENANTYISLMEKKKIAEDVAERCIVRVEMNYIPTGKEEAKQIPQRYQEDKAMTQMCLMGILAKKYLLASGIPDDLQMPLDQYDEWAGSHVINQLERLKRDSDINAKIHNILSDYKDMRFMLIDEIQTELGHHNDLLWRLLDSFSVELSQLALDGMNGLNMLNNSDAVEGMTDEQRKKIEEVRKGLDEQLEKVKGFKEQIAEKLEELKAKKGDAE